MWKLKTSTAFFALIVVMASAAVESKPTKHQKFKTPTIQELYDAQKLLLNKPASTYDEIKSVLTSRTRFKDFQPKHSLPKRSLDVHINRAEGFERFSSVPNYTMRCQIFCKAGFLLQILPDGRVQGTTNQNDIFTYIELQSYGTSLLRIKGTYSMNYLSMSRTGKIKASKSPSLRSSLFKETHEENAYNSYASYKYFYDTAFDMMLGIKGNGQLKKTWKAYPGQTATQFLVIKEGTTS